jgi:succinate-semialdehyde dehydrogenase/glutarate-semialdehyde dehydrogenase
MTGTTAEVRLFVDGDWTGGATTTALTDKYTGAMIATVHEADRALVHRAVGGVLAAHEQITLSPFARYEILSTASRLLAARRETAIRTVIADTGFTIADASREVDRTCETLLLSGEEAKRIHGEVVPIGSAPEAPDRLAFTIRVPVGVVCAITPFNSPLNTVAHKVGPALAAGNGVVLKPSNYTPLSAEFLVRLLLEAGLPPRLIAMVNGPGPTVGQALLEHPGPAFYAFTGSTGVGEQIQRTIGVRRSQLELGSLSSTIVCADADLDKAVPRAMNAAFRKAGQVCTSVQRLYVDHAVLDAFVTAVTASLAGRVAGDPNDPQTFVGPVISGKDADRIEEWIAKAAAGGASVLTGGNRSGNVIEPTVLIDVDTAMNVMCREVFGPVVSICPFNSLDDAIDMANDTPYGLSAGIFTTSIATGLDAAARLRFGTVHVNETSSNRVDLMPFGGVKRSGFGLEGPRYAVAEMTEHRLITIGG